MAVADLSFDTAPLDAAPVRPFRFAMSAGVAGDLRRLGTALCLFVALGLALTLAPETGDGAGADVWYGNVALSADPR